MTATERYVHEMRSTASQLGITLENLLTTEMPPRVEIVPGLRAGQVGLLNAVTNVGKSTLLRNLALALAAGVPYPPLTSQPGGFRVAIIDGEDNLELIRSDLLVMMTNLSDLQRQAAEENILILCETEIGGSDLNLGDVTHQLQILFRLEEFRPAIIMIDTISSTFTVEDENSNAQVRDAIMSPLKSLARQTGAVILAAHHMGKSSEQTFVRDGPHRGRGASSFADMSRAVYNLHAGTDRRVKLSCAKIKGRAFATATLRLNHESRWFEPCEGLETSIHMQLGPLIDIFNDGAVLRRNEIKKSFTGSEKMLTRYLRSAVQEGLLVRVNHGSYARAPS